MKVSESLSGPVEPKVAETGQPPATGPPESDEAEKQRLAAIANLRQQLGLDKIELQLAEIRNSGKIQPIQNGGDWKSFGQSIVSLITEGINKFGGGGGGGDNQLLNMLLEDALQTNRMTKVVFMRAIAKSQGVELPKHVIA